MQTDENKINGSIKNSFNLCWTNKIQCQTGYMTYFWPMTNFLCIYLWCRIHISIIQGLSHSLFIQKKSDKINAFFVCAFLAIGKILLLSFFFGWWKNSVLCQTFSLADDKIWLMTECLMPNFCCSTMSMPNFCQMPNLRGRYPWTNRQDKTLDY